MRGAVKKFALIFFVVLPLFAFAGSGICVFAHRGENTLAPQNTAEAVKLAYDLGSGVVEADFWQTADGHVVCVHAGGELGKYWGIDKSPEKLTLPEIKSARLKPEYTFGGKYANCKLPLIDDIFAVIPEHGRLQLEFKMYSDSLADKIEAARIRAGLGYKNIIISSFDKSALARFKAKYPQYRTMLIMSYKKGMSAEEIVEASRTANADAVTLGNYRALTADCAGKIRRAGLELGVWLVNSPSDLAYARSIGADFAASDCAAAVIRNFVLLGYPM